MRRDMQIDSVPGYDTYTTDTNTTNCTYAARLIELRPSNLVAHATRKRTYTEHDENGDEGNDGVFCLFVLLLFLLFYL
jgi:hypothetical protein